MKKQTRKVWVGNVPIGGGAPVAVQSMTTTDTADVDATVRQILQLQHAGCDIVRVAVPNEACAAALADIKKEESEYVPLPKFYTFKSRDERERILYKNFVQVGEDVKAMIVEIFNKKNAK